MKRWSMLFLVVFLLGGCDGDDFAISPGTRHIEIDWVDFVQWDEEYYEGIHTGVLADLQYLGEKIGTVQFKVADNVKDPSYRTKNGDAAFHEKGTEIYQIKGEPNFIAIPSSHEINGYQVYYSRDDMDYRWYFKDLPVDNIKRIEIYQKDDQGDNKRISEISANEEIKKFLKLLSESETNPKFLPNIENGDPVSYDMVLYTEEPIAYKYFLQYDGNTYFWAPWDTAIISGEIKQFLPS